MNKLNLKNWVGYGVWISVMLLVTFTMFACRATEDSKNEPLERPTVTVKEAGLSNASTAYRFAGTVASEQTVQLSTKVTGRVTRLDVEEGDYATQGEVLVRIKDDNLQAQKNQVEASMAEAEATLLNTETNYRRIQNLFEQESATQKELDDITTQYERAKASVKALQAKLHEVNDLLEYTVLEAPFNGYVVEKNISAGDLAGPGQPLLAFEREGAMKVNLSIPETQIDFFQVNDTVSVSVPAAGDKVLTGIVSTINPSGNRNSRQFRAEIVFPDLRSDAGLKSGMFAEVSLVSQKDGVITVPETAVIRRGQLTGLYTLNDDTEVVLRWIRLGEKNEAEKTIEVLSGLAQGEAYIASFEAPLKEGQKVNIQ